MAYKTYLLTEKLTYYKLKFIHITFLHKKANWMSIL
jgi:hypothetical protein